MQNHTYKSKSHLLAFLLRVSVLYITGTESDVSAETRTNQATAQSKAVIIWAPETQILRRSEKSPYQDRAQASNRKTSNEAFQSGAPT